MWSPDHQHKVKTCQKCKLSDPTQTNPQIYGIRNLGREVMRVRKVMRAREETAVSVVNSPCNRDPLRMESHCYRQRGIAGV